MLAKMSTHDPPEFSASPSRARAARWLRLLVYVALLALASAAIWWIDRGAMLNNAMPPPRP